MSGWIGVDLDGTLAHYDTWRGAEHIGKPIPLMLERIKYWQKTGVEVRIVTARACDPSNIPYIRTWLHEQGLADLSITNCKDFGMLQLWDDRAIQVHQNTGETVANSIETLQQREFSEFSSPGKAVLYHGHQRAGNWLKSWLDKLCSRQDKL